MATKSARLSERISGIRFILVTPLLGLRVAVLSNIVPETKALHSPIN